MLILAGGLAQSAFRLGKLLAAIQNVQPNIRSLTAEYLYLVDLEYGLKARERRVLDDLLECKPWSEPENIPTSTVEVFVVPRRGTVSPWSTKATEISQNCLLPGVRRIERGVAWRLRVSGPIIIEKVITFLHDPMTESIMTARKELQTVLQSGKPDSLDSVDILRGGRAALLAADSYFGLALSDQEIEYLLSSFRAFDRNPTDVELMMFAQVNSEHCRHKIFNALWSIDGVKQDTTLFGMIRTTHERCDNGALVAYRDNAAVVAAKDSSWFLPHPLSAEYQQFHEPAHLVVKVETHNHPTGISPFPGASTGSGGEIRDEGATGRGGKPKAGVCGFSVSNLCLPNGQRSWEVSPRHPPHVATPLQIMLEGPVGAASFNNEFGRPNIGGYFRTFEVDEQTPECNLRRGYHKPIMLAGGVGNIRTAHIEKKKITPDAKLIVLGGPGMLIGLGGGAASSATAGTSSEALDFASVQRGNPEMQRRCQEVINRCIALGENNPILSIHDVGAGGLCNALPELVYDADCGGDFELRSIPSEDSGMSPMQVWCNEAQERYVLALTSNRLSEFDAICERERCPYAIVGTATREKQLIVRNGLRTSSVEQPNFEDIIDPVNIEMELLFGQPPQMHRDVQRRRRQYPTLDLSSVTLEEAVDRVLRLPCVADKTFLITIGDRSVGGQVVRDPMVGPWQVPVADVAVTSAGFMGVLGEAMAIGERAPIALINAAASGRMAVAEALTNIAAASVSALGEVKLSANWMTAAGQPGEDADLFDTVQAVALDLCPALGLSIPVGKDSMSMATQWKEGESEFKVISPLSLVITGFAPVVDVYQVATPMLRTDFESVLLFIDLAPGYQRLGGSALAQVFNQVGTEAPDVEIPLLIRGFFAATRELLQRGLMLAYHDRSDGGLFVTLAEMAFAGRCGVEIDLGDVLEPIAALFSEELGAVLQVRNLDLIEIESIFKRHGLAEFWRVIGTATREHSEFRLNANGRQIYCRPERELHRIWSETTWRMQTLRDHPKCAQEEYDQLLDEDNPGLHASLTFDFMSKPVSAAILSGNRPKVGILREQGVNGHIEMAMAFSQAGFSAIDLTMTDLLYERKTLSEFSGLAVCGGFSFGDVLGAGRGWAKSILYEPKLRDLFESFFARDNSFALGVCNGCQALSTLKELIPGAERWPKFVQNQSEQFEARLVMAEVVDSCSVLFAGMIGSRLPIVVAHGEGRAVFEEDRDLKLLQESGQISMRYVDNYGHSSCSYPMNPNGSPGGITSLTSLDGRVTIMMPHPERVFRTVNCSWHPEDWAEFSPWFRIFQNARNFCA